CGPTTYDCGQRTKKLWPPAQDEGHTQLQRCPSEYVVGSSRRDMPIGRTAAVWVEVSAGREPEPQEGGGMSAQTLTEKPASSIVPDRLLPWVGSAAFILAVE